MLNKGQVLCQTRRATDGAAWIPIHLVVLGHRASSHASRNESEKMMEQSHFSEKPGPTEHLVFLKHVSLSGPAADGMCVSSDLSKRKVYALNLSS